MSETVERRRSPRYVCDVGLVARGENKGQPFKEDTFSVNVSAHGGVIFLSANVRIGQTLFLLNPQTGNEIQCHVARIGPPHSGLRMVGVEFETRSPEFWPFPSHK